MNKTPILSEADYRTAESLESIGDALEERGEELASSVLEKIRYRAQGIDNHDARIHTIYKTARDDWWHLTRDPAINAASFDLPEQRFLADEKEIYVLGFPHSAPGIPLSEDGKSLLNDQISEYATTGTVLVEESKSDVEHEQVTWMDDISAVHDDVVQKLEEQGKIGEWRFTAEQIRRMGLLQLFDVAGTNGRIRQPVLQRSLGERTYDYWKTGYDALQDPGNWQNFYNACKANLLPLSLQQDYDNRFNPALNILRQERSIYMAETALEVASEDEPAFLIVGMGHAPHIHDYLIDVGGEVYTKK